MRVLLLPRILFDYLQQLRRTRRRICAVVGMILEATCSLQMIKKFLLSLRLQEGMVKQDESSVLPNYMYENTMAACVPDLKPRIAEDERPQGEGRNKFPVSQVMAG